MTVGELRKALEGVAADTKVIIRCVVTRDAVSTVHRGTVFLIQSTPGEKQDVSHSR